MQSPADILKDIWTSAGGDAPALERVRLSGEEPQLPSSFRVAIAGQTTIAAAGLAAAEIWRLRSGQTQDVSVDMRHAVAECRSERYLLLDDKPPPPAWDAIAGVYRTGDNRFVRCHTNFPHHRDAVCKVLGCEAERDKVQAALMQWRDEDFETAAYAAGGVVALMRSYDEWSALPQARALAELPLLSIEKIGEAPPKPWPKGDRPLSGLRVLDLSRVIAGPVAGRTLAAHGADVLLVSGPELPAIPWLTIDTGRGKLTTFIELKSETGRAHLRELLRDADIFSQGYRPRALAALGFAPEDAAQINPGIVYVTLSAYGHAGPWAERRGFDSLVQTTTGFNHAEGRAAGSRWPQGIAGADARSRHRLSDGVRRDDGQGASGPRRRQLARACVAGADRALALESRPARWRTEHPGSYGRRCTCCVHRERAIWLRHVEGGAPFGDAVEDAGAMEPSGNAARQSSGTVAGAKLT
ncbi:crotonobetainyl-CoA:carnitine CoA-transferase CaiB-like acyl-CoA transferase [Bradyrhizobium ottawaense]